MDGKVNGHSCWSWFSLGVTSGHSARDGKRRVRHTILPQILYAWKPERNLCQVHDLTLAHRRGPRFPHVPRCGGWWPEDMQVPRVEKGATSRGSEKTGPLLFKGPTSTREKLSSQRFASSLKRPTCVAIRIVLSTNVYTHLSGSRSLPLYVTSHGTPLK